MRGFPGRHTILQSVPEEEWDADSKMPQSRGSQSVKSVSRRGIQRGLLPFGPLSDPYSALLPIYSHPSRNTPLSLDRAPGVVSHLGRLDMPGRAADSVISCRRRRRRSRHGTEGQTDRAAEAVVNRRGKDDIFPPCLPPSLECQSPQQRTEGRRKSCI